MCDTVCNIGKIPNKLTLAVDNCGITIEIQAHQELAAEEDARGADVQHSEQGLNTEGAPCRRSAGESVCAAGSRRATVLEQERS
jgi:hypothetical protein